MAIYHFHASIIGRSAGRSAVAAAAWQNACRLRDRRINQLSDFTGHRSIAFSAITLPSDTPLELENRERLWNAVEAVEVRRDAQLARQFDVALPDEFDAGECIDVLLRFASWELTAHRYPADLTLIETGNETGGRRHHGYAMIPTRPLGREGFGAKDREWNTRKKLVEIRSAWAEVLNDRLVTLGHIALVDHRSNKDRGIDAYPGDHVGIFATQIAKRSERPLTA